MRGLQLLKRRDTVICVELKVRAVSTTRAGLPSLPQTHGLLSDSDAQEPMTGEFPLASNANPSSSNWRFACTQ